MVTPNTAMAPTRVHHNHMEGNILPHNGARLEKTSHGILIHSLSGLLRHPLAPAEAEEASKVNAIIINRMSLVKLLSSMTLRYEN
jgi:hypothetical protein